MPIHFNPSRTAVLSIHMLNDIISKHGKFGQFFGDQIEERKVIEKGIQLFEAVRTSSPPIPIYHVRVCYQPDYSDMYINSELLAETRKMNALVHGTWGTEFVQGLEPAGNEYIINHQRSIPFHGTDFEKMLKEKGIESLILFGVSTNFAVEGTARFAGDRGYDVYVVEDCCAAATVEAHKEAIGTLRMLTHVVSLEDVMQQLKPQSNSYSA